MSITINVPKEVEHEAKTEKESVEKRVELILKSRYLLRIDDVASWYFRLNGFFTITDFVLHSSNRKQPSQRTDADLIGIRFPFREELDLSDDQHFGSLAVPMLAIVELTKGPCKINGPWSKKENENIDYLLKALGLFKPKEIRKIAQSLYNDCLYQNEFATVQMFAGGTSKSEDLKKILPGAIQITVSEMLAFIYDRFSKRRWRKENHKSWDRIGQTLWDESENKSEADFTAGVVKMLL